MALKTRPYDTAEYLTDDEAIAEYLTASQEENDIDFLSKALHQAIRGYGIAHIATLTGISHEDVVRALHVEEDADAEILLRVLEALGVKPSAMRATRTAA